MRQEAETPEAPEALRSRAEEEKGRLREEVAQAKAETARAEARWAAAKAEAAKAREDAAADKAAAIAAAAAAAARPHSLPDDEGPGGSSRVANNGSAAAINGLAVAEQVEAEVARRQAEAALVVEQCANFRDEILGQVKERVGKAQRSSKGMPTR